MFSSLWWVERLATLLFPFLILSPLWLRWVFEVKHHRYTFYSSIRIFKIGICSVYLFKSKKEKGFKIVIEYIFFNLIFFFLQNLPNRNEAKPIIKMQWHLRNRRREMIKRVLKIEWLPVGMLLLMTVLWGKWNKWKQKESSSLKGPSTSSDCKVLLWPSGPAGECGPGWLSPLVSHPLLWEKGSRRGWGTHRESLALWMLQSTCQVKIHNHRGKYSLCDSFPRLRSD